MENKYLNLKNKYLNLKNNYKTIIGGTEDSNTEIELSDIQMLAYDENNKRQFIDRVKTNTSRNTYLLSELNDDIIEQFDLEKIASTLDKLEFIDNISENYKLIFDQDITEEKIIDLFRNDLKYIYDINDNYDLLLDLAAIKQKYGFTLNIEDYKDIHIKICEIKYQKYSNLEYIFDNYSKLPGYNLDISESSNDRDIINFKTKLEYLIILQSFGQSFNIVIQDFYSKDINTLQNTIDKYNLINKIKMIQNIIINKLTEINSTIENITFQSNNIVQTLDFDSIENEYQRIELLRILITHSNFSWKLIDKSCEIVNSEFISNFINTVSIIKINFYIKKLNKKKIQSGIISP